MSTYSLLHPKYIFGMNANCKASNVYFIDTNTIMYPAGNTVIMYNMDQKSQTFLHGVEKAKGVTALTVSNSKTFAAVAQLGEKQPTISIFDVKMNKRKKTLLYPETTATEYVSLSFTSDGIQLASLTGPPEFALLFWKWDKGRMICQAKTTGGLGPVYEVSSSPVENNVMCVVGRSSFRFFRTGEGHMKPFGFQKGDSYHFLCHAWLGKGDRLIAGTRDGRLMYFERGDYRCEIHIPSVSDPNTHSAKTGTDGMKRDSVVNLASLIGVGGGNAEAGEGHRGSLASKKSAASTIYEAKGVTAMVAFTKGFAIGYGPGYVIVYEEQVAYESQEDHFKPMHVIRVPYQSTETGDKVIRALTINATEEMLVATTANSQLLYFSLPSAEIKNPNEMFFEYALASFHYGAVIAMDVAVRKSLFVTVGADHFIRVWNYMTMTQEASKEFAEEIFSISFHPTGLFLLAGFIDKVRIFSIVMDDIREIRDFHIRGCKKCVFSNGGHLFAVVNGNIIQVYTTTSFDNVGNMKGHSNKIRSLRWSNDDSLLVSVGADGAIYEWDIVAMHRESDYVERGADMLDVTISPDGKTHYAISANKFVKEIQIQDGILLKEVDLEMEPKCITMSRSGRVLVVGMEMGVIRSLRQPLTYSNEWFDFRIHLDQINAIRITCDEAFCISVSEDGSIILWKITDPEGRTAKLEKEILYATEVLITKADLDERDLAMRELKQKFGELRLEMEYQMKRKEMSYQEEIKALNSTNKSQIDELNIKINELVSTKEEHDANYHAFVEQMATEQKLTLENIQAHYNTRLISEFEKYNELQNLLEETIKDYETKLTGLDGDCEKAVEELVGYFEGKIKDKGAALEEAYDAARNTLTESEELKKQIEEDADTEILQVTYSYEKKLRQEQSANAKLRADSGIMKRNFAAMNQEIESQKGEVLKLHHEGEKMKSTIMLSEKEVQSLRKDLVDRDVNVMGKEKVIYDLKKTNGELEKYKFVLDYKIKELKKMIEPKEREIVYLKQQNTDMEQELGTTVAVRNGLELQVNELTNKLGVTEQECEIEKRLRRKLQVLVGRIRSHMSRCMNLLQDHRALKSSIQAMYEKYGHTLDVGQGTSEDQEAICQLVRQKNYLEQCLSSIKKKMQKEVDSTRNEQIKIMHENMLLVFEINNLRRELKLTRDRAQSYEVCLGVLPANFNSSKTTEMKLKLHTAIRDNEEVSLRHDQQLQEKQNVIESQTNEIQHLVDKLLKTQG